MNNSNLESIKSALKRILVEDLDIGLKYDQLDENIPLYDEGIGLDSISIINFLMLIEKEFRINFDETEVTASIFSSITNLADFLKKKISQNVN